MHTSSMLFYVEIKVMLKARLRGLRSKLNSEK